MCTVDYGGLQGEQGVCKGNDKGCTGDDRGNTGVDRRKQGFPEPVLIARAFFMNILKISKLAFDQ